MRTSLIIITILAICASLVGCYFAGAKIEMVVTINRHGDTYNTSTGCLSIECDNKHKTYCRDPYYAHCHLGGIMFLILFIAIVLPICFGICLAIYMCYENLTRKINKECNDNNTYEIKKCDNKNKITEDNDNVIALSSVTDTSNISSCVNISTSTM